MMKWQTVLVLACLWLGGCRVGFGGLLREITGPSRAELASDAFSGTNSPDEQRTAIEGMLNRYWGLNQMPLAGYALLASDANTDPTVRSAALRALAMAEQDAVGAIDNITTALKSGPDDVRWDAAVVLDRIVGAKAVEPLRTAVANDENVDVRIAAVTALRHYRTTKVTTTLVAAMADDNDYSVRKRAHESLVEIAGRYLGASPRDWAPLTKRIPPLPVPTPPWWDIFHTTVKTNDAPKPPPKTDEPSDGDA